MQIRTMEARDIAPVAALLRQLAIQFITNEMSAEAGAAFLDQHDAPALARRLEQAYQYQVAEQDDVIIGFVGVREQSHLFHLFVAQAWHGRGVARALWQHAMQHAGHHGPYTVNASTYALKAYQALGFVPTMPAQCANGVTYTPMRYGAAA